MQKKQTGGFARMLRRQPKPLWLVIVCHILALGAALLLYATFHHVIMREEMAEGVRSSRSGAVEVMAQETPAPEVQSAMVALLRSEMAFAGATRSKEGIGYSVVKGWLFSFFSSISTARFAPRSSSKKLRRMPLGRYPS